MSEKEYGYVRGVSPAPLSPLPSMPEMSALSEKEGLDAGANAGGHKTNGSFSLFPPPLGGKKGGANGANLPKDF